MIEYLLDKIKGKPAVVEEEVTNPCCEIVLPSMDSPRMSEPGFINTPRQIDVKSLSTLMEELADTNADTLDEWLSLQPNSAEKDYILEQLALSANLAAQKKGADKIKNLSAQILQEGV